MSDSNQALHHSTHDQDNLQEENDTVDREGLEEARLTLAQATEEVLSEEDQPSVLLVVPTLNVEELRLDVDDLEARVSLHAELANMLKLDVGVTAHLGQVNLELKGVEAQALLKVRLRTVADIIDRVLTTVDSNPEILRELLQPVGDSISELGEAAEQATGDVSRATTDSVDALGDATRTVNAQEASQAKRVSSSVGPQAAARRSPNVSNGRSTQNAQLLLREATDDQGQGIRRRIDRYGDIIQQTLNSQGQVVEEEIIGRVADLVVVEE